MRQRPRDRKSAFGEIRNFKNTERPVTIEEGTNVLAGVTRAGILAGFAEAERKTRGGARVPELWDGRASERIVAVLAEITESE